MYSHTRGIPVALHKEAKLDSMVIKYQDRVFTVQDTNELKTLMEHIRLSKKYKADRVNINRSLIIINFYLRSGEQEELMILENVYHGYLLVADWTYYKNDLFVSAIRKYIH